MLYLLGGVGRSGKSTVARRFLLETGVPFFDLDYLMMGLSKGLPYSGVNPLDDNLYTGELLWPVVKPMVTAMIENGFEYLIEGVQLVPKYVADLHEEFEGVVRSCFIGFADVDVKSKLDQIKSYKGRLNDLIEELSDEEAMKDIEKFKMQSKYLQDECNKYGLKYYESTANLEQTVDRVVRYLRG